MGLRSSQSRPAFPPLPWEKSWDWPKTSPREPFTQKKVGIQQVEMGAATSRHDTWPFASTKPLKNPTQRKEMDKKSILRLYLPTAFDFFFLPITSCECLATALPRLSYDKRPQMSRTFSNHSLVSRLWGDLAVAGSYAAQYVWDPSASSTFLQNVVTHHTVAAMRSNKSNMLKEIAVGGNVPIVNEQVTDASLSVGLMK